MNFLIDIIYGLSLGAMYAMIALGYTMVYGIAKMLNFAHGDIITFGAYTVVIVSTSAIMPALNLPVWVGFLAAIVLCAFLGFIIEKIAYKPLRGASSLAVLITAIGVSYFLQNFLRIIFGPGVYAFPDIPLFNTLWYITPEYGIKSGDVFTLIFAVIIMIALTLFVKKTQTGRAMLAVSEDRKAALLMGVNVNKTIAITFIIGSALAAIAGICYGYTRIYVRPTEGALPGIKAFVAAVLGGIGSIPGAFVGGLALGIIEYFSQRFIPDWVDVIVFGLLILVLLLKPTGILGKKRNEKV